jgi:hypothetical protein
VPLTQFELEFDVDVRSVGAGGSGYFTGHFSYQTSTGVWTRVPFQGGLILINSTVSNLLDIRAGYSSTGIQILTETGSIVVSQI